MTRAALPPLCPSEIETRFVQQEIEHSKTEIIDAEKRVEKGNG